MHSSLFQKDFFNTFLSNYNCGLRCSLWARHCSRCYAEVVGTNLSSDSRVQGILHLFIFYKLIFILSSYPTRMTGNFTSVIFWALPIQEAVVLGTKVPWHTVQGPSSLSHLCTRAPSRISTVPAGTVFQIQWLLWHTPAEARALLLRHRTPTSLMHLWPLFSGVLPGSRTWVPTAQRHAEPLKKSRESPFSLRKASLPITFSNNSASSTIPLLPSIPLEPLYSLMRLHFTNKSWCVSAGYFSFLSPHPAPLGHCTVLQWVGDREVDGEI